MLETADGEDSKSHKESMSELSAHSVDEATVKKAFVSRFNIHLVFAVVLLL